MESLDALLIRTAEQDQEAFKQLYDLASPRLFALCLQMLGNDHAAAEDLLQEGFVKIWHNAQRFSAEKGNAMTWMMAVMRNQLLSHLRYVSRRPVFDDEPEYETLAYAAEDSQPEVLQHFHEQATALQNALNALPQKHRECVMQSFYYGYSHTEIAERLSLPLGTVKAWVRRGVSGLEKKAHAASSAVAPL